MKMVISLLIMLGVVLLVGTKLVSGASWSGYVLEENGTGIDVVNVTAILTGTNAFINSTFTNISGFFKIVIPSVTSIKIVSSKSGYLTDTSQSLPPTSTDSILPFNITLEKALPGNITGKVTNSTGFGIENVTVSAIQGNSMINSTSTDSNGDYLLAYLLDGTYTIEASALGYITQNTTNVVLLPNSTTIQDFVLNPDITPPVITSVSATLITSSETVIIWQTDELANSSVSYGTTTSTILNSGSATLITSHMVRLSSLSSSTLYYYNVSSCDFAGNCNISTQFNFTTSSVAVEQEASTSGGGGGGVAALTTTTKFLSEGARIAINVEGEIHYVEVIEITNTTVTINVSSTPQQAILSINEEKKFEITDDDFYDILIRLNGIENNKANITISLIHEQIQPKKLLDITFNLIDNPIKDISELIAIISFENFGTKPTPVSLLFTILDQNGREVYSEEDRVTVETEKLLRKSFEDTDLPNGEYTLILTTLYNTDVVDEFRQEFKIGKERRGITGRATEFFERGEVWYSILIFVIIILISFTVYFIRKLARENRNEQII